MDQRGHTRPFGTHCDVGSFEYDGTLTLPELTPTSVPPTATATPTNTPVAPTATPTTAPACANAPAAPMLNTPADGAQVKTKNVALDWSDSACATRYKLVVRDLTDKTDVISKNNLTTSDFVAKKLIKSHKYRWTVQACSTAGCSAKAEATFKIK